MQEQGNQMGNGLGSARYYPTPNPPMIGKYMVRNRYVAAGLATIDSACAVISRFTPTIGASTDINSILVSQGGHLGDLLMTLPMLHWLRRNRPHVKIGLVVGSWAVPMMTSLNELYDSFYIADHFRLDRSNRPLRQKLARHLASWKTAITEIRRDRYDAAVDCYSFYQNNIPLLYMCNIPVRAGFTSGGFGPLLTHRATWIHESRPILDYHRDLLRLLFKDESLRIPLGPFYPAPTVSTSFSEPPYVIVQTGTGNAIKEWPDDRWIELVKELKSQGTKVILAGAGARERERCARIREKVEGVVDLCDKLSWNKFASLVEHAAHVVCLDSSTSHLAAALQIPSTVISSGITDQVQFGPAGGQAEIFSFPTPCTPCFRSNGCEHMACVRRVGVAEIAHSVTSRLAAMND
jgi:ADP-heptose:LPS heptosyltransferase